MLNRFENFTNQEQAEMLCAMKSVHGFFRSNTLESLQKELSKEMKKQGTLNDQD